MNTLPKTGRWTCKTGMIVAIAAVSACSSGGPCEGLSPCVGGPDYINLISGDTDGAATLQAATLNATARATSIERGVINRSEASLSLGGVGGTLNADGTNVALDGGGTLALDNTGSAYAARFDATLRARDRTTGVIGIATQAGDMPSIGTARYRGTSQLTVLNGVDTYDLSGQATITADFGSGDVAATLTTLDGVRIPGFGETQNVTDVATITITGARVSGTTFAGGAASVDSARLADLSDAAQTQLSGSFYGPRAIEAGASLVVNDTGSGGMLVLGDVLVGR